MEQERVKLDRWGYEVNTTSDACISAINSYYEQVLSYGRKRSVILEAVAEDEGCVLANVLAAEYLAYVDTPRAFPLIKVAKSHLGQATPYEKAVFDCISNWIYSNRDDDVAFDLHSNRDDDVAFDLHSKLLKDFPRELASLKRAQILCFYTGRMDLFLHLAKQVLPHNEHEGYIHGMLGFALLELGQISEAEEASKKGFKINPNDAWAQHCMCHVLQYQCRFKEAIDFMEECSESWNSCSSFMLTHNWWHVSLCYLESHSSIRKVINIYDNHIWGELEKHDAACPEVYLNALGLLLRLYVRDHIDVAEDRLKILVRHLTDQNTWHLEWHLDLLILWGLACAGEISKAEELLGSLKSKFSNMSEKKQLSMLKALLLAEAMLEYGRGNYDQAVELFSPEFDAMSCKVIGASDEQLDVFNEVWYTVLLNTGQVDYAVEVIKKQIKKRDGAPFLWLLLEKGYKAMCMPEAAADARNQVQTLESVYL